MVMPLPSTPPEARIPIKNYRAWVNELRRLGGKDANAALRAQIGDKPPAEGAQTGRMSTA